MGTSIGDYFEQQAELEQAIAKLEERAGITEAVADAKLGPFVPNFNASSEEYFDDVEHHARRKVRSLYFDIGDDTLRRDLIHLHREQHRNWGQRLEKDLKEARSNLAKARRAPAWIPWFFAATAGAICVAIGAKYFELYGALAGAVAGIFIGQGIAASAKREQAEKLRVAEIDLTDAQEAITDRAKSPEWFNESEEQNGEPDRDFDDPS